MGIGWHAMGELMDGYTPAVRRYLSGLQSVQCMHADEVGLLIA